RFRRMVQQNITSNKDTLVLLQEPNEHPFYVSGQYNQVRKVLNGDNAQLAYYSPFLGVVPEEASDLFLAAHHVSARTEFKVDEFPTFVDAVTSYIKKNGFKRLIVVADDFVKDVLDQIGIKLVVLQKDAKIDEIASAVNQR
ncbi:MAG: DUF5591 domain-containing protein, partial [Nitrososphaerales archaeon]